MVQPAKHLIKPTIMGWVCNSTARRCVLPGDLQGRSRQFYEDILHVISHFNIEFKGVADFNPS
jgi:hypothetical protein